MPLLTVIIPAHNPDPDRLRRVLAGLASQTLPTADQEIVIVDNASSSFPADDFFRAVLGNLSWSVIREPTPGLTSARRCGLQTAKGAFAVFVDDDNVLAPSYLTEVVSLFGRHPHVGALGGKSLPDFERPPATWTEEFHGLLAVRDFGPTPLISTGLRSVNSSHASYPEFAPIGAGMALRREAWTIWTNRLTNGEIALSDRRGSELTSSGDNDIVLTLMHAGWETGYFPTLSLQHLIPPSRLAPQYLARLNRSIQRSWMQVLTLHHANPHPPLTPAGAWLRKAKAWVRYRAWTSPAAHIRWQGACGQFDGRVRR